eukprot:TRINITY_DN2361_c0_g1_i2.p1 TRINITY_DN2361_c0_g1~~TRINITY_DN2361_c0_g1_i2.p1  ORF type:complete len:422 (+),score=79.82 TRINITY_DN2361_c0_g1_i2:106-1371(+)
MIPFSSLPLSHWIMYHRKRHKQSVNVWAEEFNKVTPKRKLIFLYLANDIVQNSRKKGIEFIHEFGKVLPQAITSSYSEADERSRQKISRMMDIWVQRRVFDPKIVANIRSVIGLPSHTSQPSFTRSRAQPTDMILPTADPLIQTMKDMQESAILTELVAEKVARLQMGLFSVNSLLPISTRTELELYTSNVNAGSALVQQFKARLEDDRKKKNEFIAALTARLTEQEQHLSVITVNIQDCDTKLAQAEQIHKQLLVLKATLPAEVNIPQQQLLSTTIPTTIPTTTIPTSITQLNESKKRPREESATPAEQLDGTNTPEGSPPTTPTGPPGGYIPGTEALGEGPPFKKAKYLQDSVQAMFTPAMLNSLSAVATINPNVFDQQNLTGAPAAAGYPPPATNIYDQTPPQYYQNPNQSAHQIFPH